ncbi:hypothetical protein MNBD_ALPHA11-2034 [hydrothermal vent metagenome]|uniref:FAD dependent oxidoreductase domain-containing protein n=1 Tax=hydrothermal vent metagenome TaxID=652676 RepID=A0A3B0UQ71_9ZZZZ
MQNLEIGIVGTSLQAALLCGLLAKNHKKKVCLFIESSVLVRLCRQTCLSFNISIRPQTWKLNESNLSEASAIIAKIGGKNALTRVSPLILCKGKSGGRAMAHMYHLLRSNDYEIERLSEQKYPLTSGAYRIRGAKTVHSQIMWPQLFKWLKELGVTIADPGEFTFSFRRDGSVAAKSSKGLKSDLKVIEMDRFILADEASILTHGRNEDVNRLFMPIQTSSIVTAPSGQNKEKFILSPEYNFCATSNPDGGFKVLADAPINKFGALLADLVDPNPEFYLQGKAVFNTLKSRDGAPIVGSVTPSSPWLLGGLGNYAMFLTPAIARYICDVATDSELEYFTAHTASKNRKPHAIADYIGYTSGAD